MLPSFALVDTSPDNAAHERHPTKETSDAVKNVCVSGKFQTRDPDGPLAAPFFAERKLGQKETSSSSNGLWGGISGIASRGGGGGGGGAF